MCERYNGGGIHFDGVRSSRIDFLLVIIELFLLGVTAETLQANIDWKSPFLKGWVNLAQNFR